MDTETQKIINEQLENLPKAMKEALLASNYQNKVQDIAKKYQLMIDESGKLYIETTLVMLGIEPISNFFDNLVQNIGIPEAKAVSIANDIDDSILKSIRGYLIEINKQFKAPKNNDTEQEKNQPISTPSKDSILAGIETPEKMSGEGSISVSSLGSNKNLPEIQIPIKPVQSEKMEIRKDLLPEVETGAIIINPKVPTEGDWKESAPTMSDLKSKMTEGTIMQKEKTVIEEKTKIPEKPRSNDAYREAIE